MSNGGRDSYPVYSSSRSSSSSSLIVIVSMRAMRLMLMGMSDIGIVKTGLRSQFKRTSSSSRRSCSRLGGNITIIGEVVGAEGKLAGSIRSRSRSRSMITSLVVVSLIVIRRIGWIGVYHYRGEWIHVAEELAEGLFAIGAVQMLSKEFVQIVVGGNGIR